MNGFNIHLFTLNVLFSYMIFFRQFSLPIRKIQAYLQFEKRNRRINNISMILEIKMQGKIGHVLYN